MDLSLPRFDTADVVIVGDVMLDRYWHGPTSRVSPEAPVPVVKVEAIEDRPGGAGNVALNISALGARPVLLGVVGDDEAGKSLHDSLSSARVSCDFLKSTAAPTITKLRAISRHQQLLRMDFEEDFSDIKSSAMKGLLEQSLGDASVLVISDYAKGAVSNPGELIRLARDKNVKVLVDPKGSDFSKYKGATLLTPNLHEFEEVAGVSSSEEELVSKGQELIKQFDLEALLVTRGEHGMTLIRPDAPEFHLPARAREVFDVTGAGDTVIAVLASSLASGASLEDSVAFANLAASIAVGKLGTVAVSAPELRRALQKETGSEKGVMTSEQLAIVIADARAHGERVVFTNGCFDIIHAGHVAYLQEARSLADRLVVAINSDESVTKLKGPGRPINPVERRMAVLAALAPVDWVVSFADDTPEELMRELQPDVLVKGGDYALDEVVGAPIVQSYGGEVKVLSMVDECSTTAIVDKIVDKATKGSE